MTRIFQIVTLLAVIGLLNASRAFAQSDAQDAQESAGSGGASSSTSTSSSGSGESTGPAGAASRYQRMFNPQTVETIRGQVVRVETATPMRGMGRGVHLVVRTDSGTIPVHLGPSWFIDNQETQIEPDDQVEITGSQITVNGRPALIASQIRKDGQVLQLRDPSGRPVWAAWRSGGGPGYGAGGGMGGQGMGQGMGPGMMQGRGMQGGMMNQQPMAERSKEMMARHQQMIAKLREAETTLQQKVDRMDAAQGQDKINAMAEVINELAAQHKAVIDHFATMQERMVTHMQQMQQRMGGPPAGQGGTGGSSQSESGSDQDQCPGHPEHHEQNAPESQP